jgi:DNA-binding Lrp family transcriptional regulator
MILNQSLDSIDRDILNLIQSEFPITTRPFLEVAQKLAMSEEAVLARVRKLKKKGIIRRLGANFDSRKMGFVSTLCAARVPPGKLDAFVRVVNEYPGVTHNYHRQHDYNVWFTFIAPSKEEIERSLDDIREKTGIREIRNLPAIKTFKIKVDFSM